MTHDPARSDAASEEWSQEPDGFNNLKFGSTKEEVEKHYIVEHYGLISDGMASDLPYPACGRITFSFNDIPITASLIFTPANGLHCIQGSFPSTTFENIKSSLMDLYGPPHEHSSEVQALREVREKNVPEAALDPNNIMVESILWFSARVFVSLTSHQFDQSIGGLFLATDSYMRNRSGWEKMVERAKRKLAFSQEVYQPPDGWFQEPEGFGNLKLEMTKAEVEKQIELGEHTELRYSNVLYKVSLRVGGTAVAGTLTFNSDRLLTVSGEFDKAHWDSVKSTFVELYGKPHTLRREEIFEMGMSETLDWSGDRTWVRLIDFPDGKNPRFYLQPSLKGAVIQSSLEVIALPPSEPPKIGIEHHESKLVLHLPDGSTIDYPRIHHATTLLSYSWQRGANGLFVYDWDIDTTNLSSVSIGDQDNEGTSEDSPSRPDGWFYLYSNSWRRTGVPPNEITRFSIESTKLPGPVPLFVSRTDQKPGVGWSIPATLPRKVYRAVGESLVGQTAFLNNWFVIGPAIPRGSQEDYLRHLIELWVDLYGFHFLEPILDTSTRLSDGLDRLTPVSPLEAKIVECLRGALRSEPNSDS